MAIYHEYSIVWKTDNANSPDSIYLIFIAQGAVKYTFLAAAIRKCGGNEEKGRTLYAAYGSNGQVFFLLCYVVQLLHFFKPKFYLMLKTLKCTKKNALKQSHGL